MAKVAAKIISNVTVKDITGEKESFENLLRMVKARVDSMTADTTGASR